MIVKIYFPNHYLYFELRFIIYIIVRIKGDVIDTEEYLSVDGTALWTKYKKKFVARSLLVPQLEVEFYWTTNFGISSKSFTLSSPLENLNATELLKNVMNEDVQNGRDKPHTFLKKLVEDNNKLERENKINIARNQQTPSNSSSNVTNRNVSKEANPKQNGWDKFLNKDQKSSSLKQATIGYFNSEPIERLKEILVAPKQEVPSAIFLGKTYIFKYR